MSNQDSIISKVEDLIHTSTVSKTPGLMYFEIKKITEDVDEEYLKLEFVVDPEIISEEDAQDLGYEIHNLVSTFIGVPIYISWKFGIPNFKINEQTVVSNPEKVLVDSFLETFTIKGICGFWTDTSDEGEKISVYVVIDLDWLKTQQAKPEIVARKVREYVKDEVLKWTNQKVFVGSTTKKCEIK